MQSAMAAAARTSAWLTLNNGWPQMQAVLVDSDLCRGCGDCELICEFGAIQLQPDPNPGSDREQVAWVDPAICRGEGICVVHCPASAISAGQTSAAQIDAMLEAVLE